MSQINVTTIRNRTGGPPSLDQGVVVGSAATFSSTVSIAGTLTYEDVTNIDSVGIITAQSYVSIADSIVHTGDINTSLRFPAADTFTVETGGSERIRVDSSGRLAIGNNTPQSFTGNSSDNLVVGSGSGGEGITIYSATDNQGALSFADGTSGDAQYRGALSYNHTADRMDFRVNGTTIAAAIDSAGKFGIGTQSPGTELHVNGTTPIFRLSNGSTNIFEVKADSTTTAIRNTTNTALEFSTNDTARLTIANSGASTFTANVTTSANIISGTWSSGNDYSVLLPGEIRSYKDATTSDRVWEGGYDSTTTSYITGEGAAWFAAGNFDLASYGALSIKRTDGNNYPLIRWGTDTNYSGGGIYPDGSTYFASKMGIGTNVPERKLSVVDSAGSMVHFGVSPSSGGYLGSTSANQAFLSGGAYYNGSAWVATDTSAGKFRTNTGALFFCTNSGLTVGGTFTPTVRLKIRDDGGYRYFCSDSYEVASSLATDSTNQGWRFFSGATAIDTGTIRAYIRGDGAYWFAGSDVSDKDLKENITNLGSGSLNLIKQLTPCTYNFKVSEGYTDESRTGFIAQNVASVFGTSNGVATGTDGQKDMCVDYNGITAHLTAALQEAITKIETLEAKVAALEA